ncbi:MAG: hydrogenase nickel incorporation protein HypB [Candidatus Krumholzibacteriota bacterium]|nr:hydrogenase nickel incorporation protein HypB [Candidatus Krumholzibacteriota bacterium]
MHQINIGEDLRGKNREIAEENRKMLKEHDVFSLNIMSAPGAGKTTLLVKSLPMITGRFRVGVIEGDLQTSRDAERVRETGVDVFQIQTGGVCHLDASMVHSALHSFDLDAIDILLIENVGNLVCPAEFDLGVDGRVMLMSITEGDDKPKKYPLMFSESRLLMLNKVDLADYVDFDIGKARSEAKEINPDIEILEISCRSGKGLDEWVAWIEGFRKNTRGE